MAVPVLIVVVVPSVPDPLVHTFGGLVSKASDSAKFFTWCITPLRKKKSLFGGWVWGRGSGGGGRDVVAGTRVFENVELSVI